MTAILDLTWSRVDFGRRQIRLSDGVGGKKGRATVPFSDDTAALLLAARDAAQTPYVIEWAGKRVKSIKKGFGRACERAGLEGVSPHVMRHTAGVWMAEAGRPMDEIAQYLGHTDSGVTARVYARYSPDYLRGTGSILG